MPTSTLESGFLVFVIIQGEAGIPSRLGVLGWMNVWCAAESMKGVWLWSPHGVHSPLPEARGVLIWSRATPLGGHQSRSYMGSLWLWDVWNISSRRAARNRWSKSCLSSLSVGNWWLCTSFPYSLILLYPVSIWVQAKVKRLLYNVCMYAWQIQERLHRWLQCGANIPETLEILSNR
jgi:hypothetical protein